MNDATKDSVSTETKPELSETLRDNEQLKALVETYTKALENQRNTLKITQLKSKAQLTAIRKILEGTDALIALIETDKGD